ncbi:helix-turn-helix transcriptional regulator [Polaribacter sp. Hel_I_88]|uniref:helix-turn-helix transcriptional regulator n=1 Tax=Polaribacter sp. Hel_I_88 TaxID=1250006 RepID=UPI00047D514C|nr:helix-turn-helix transcriptional regulator [Polaribacter sp. Hel_I_88]
MSKNLNSIVEKTATQWIIRAEQDLKNRRKIKRAQLFALDLMDYMDDNHLKQTDVAKLMDVTPQQVNKILRAKANLTFETLDKIEEALGVTISNPKIMVASKTISYKKIGKKMQVVHKNTNSSVKIEANSKSITNKNPVLKTTMETANEYLFTADQI